MKQMMTISGIEKKQINSEHLDIQMQKTLEEKMKMEVQQMILQNIEQHKETITMKKQVIINKSILQKRKQKVL